MFQQYGRMQISRTLSTGPWQRQVSNLPTSEEKETEKEAPLQDEGGKSAHHHGKASLDPDSNKLF